MKAYEKRDLCVKCGLENSKATATALIEFLDWAESVLEREDKSRGGGDMELQESTYYMSMDDFVQGEEEDLYESEDEDGSDEGADGDN